MKKIIYLLAILCTTLGFSQDIEWDPNTTFDAVFDIPESLQVLHGLKWEKTS